MTEPEPGRTHLEADDYSTPGVHSEHGHYHRRRRRRRKKRISRRKLRIALVLAIACCIGLGYLLYELNDPTPKTQKFDPQNYRKDINDLIKKK